MIVTAINTPKSVNMRTVVLIPIVPALLRQLSSGCGPGRQRAVFSLWIEAGVRYQYDYVGTIRRILGSTEIRDNLPISR